MTQVKSDRCSERVIVVGLGYVGLPLAVAMAEKFSVTGFDIDEARILELSGGFDRTEEVDGLRLANSSAKFTSSLDDCVDADLYIVTVPTPVDSENRPDITALRNASKAVATLLRRGTGTIVVYESTVYPGVTEDVCGPILEQESGLICGVDFFLGYSPERINPGDREHTIERITKVVAGQTPHVTDRLAAVYGAITSGGTFKAASIKAAEAAKVIENSQRDINIAFMNEITQIFAKLEISIWDVLDAAQTKWNFLPFQPGLVGGHCIGVDPYYLSFRAQQLGHQPEVILAGRATNDSMATWIAESLHRMADRPLDILVLGLTFKEDVPDLRNSKVADLVARLVERGHHVRVHDPMASPEEAKSEYDITLEPSLEGAADLLIAAVPHRQYREMGSGKLESLIVDGGLLADLKGIYRDLVLAQGIRRWTL